MQTSIGTVLEQTTDAVTADPALAQAAVAVTGDLGDGCQVAVDLGERTLSFDMPAPLGGTDTAPSPGQYALAALAACQAITYRIWSEKLGVALDAVRVDVRGDVDLHGLLGVGSDARSGFGRVDIGVEITGPETPERYAQLRRAVEQHCPILDVFAAPVPVSASMRIVGTEVA